MVDTLQIRDLEKKYMNKIVKIFNSEEFKNNLLELEDFIVNHYEFLDKNWGEKNKAKVGVERLIRYHAYKYFDVKNVYPSPLSPDMGVELDDVILCIDAKTIDMVGNPGDDKSLHFQKAQITFENKPLYEKKISNDLDFPGVSFPPYLLPYYKSKPCLTYFVIVSYYDDGNSFKLSHVCICNMPHKQTVQEDFDNDIIDNYKTYEYLGKAQATPLGEAYLPSLKEKDEWKEFKIHTAKAFIDPRVHHPISKSICARKKIDKQWKIVLYGGSARVYKPKLKVRQDSSGNNWIGLKTIDCDKLGS